MTQEQGPPALPANRKEPRDLKQGYYSESEMEEELVCSGCSRRGGCGGCGGGEAVWRAAAAEAACAALLVLLTCLPGCAQAPPLQRALAAGTLVAALVQSFDHISGAMMNPTVTLAAVVVGQVGAARGAAFVFAQAAGALAGGGLLHALAPAAARCCRTLPAPTLTLAQAVCVEAVLGAVLALANCASWDARNRRLLDSWPLRIGLTVTALTLAAGELTGASVNPVRSLAPALYSGDWRAQWVYCAGPPAGALCAAALYRCVWRAPRGAQPRGRDRPDAHHHHTQHHQHQHHTAQHENNYYVT